jgi:CO/xanthine dehydrogenase FAD-binding subunit
MSVGNTRKENAVILWREYFPKYEYFKASSLEKALKLKAEYGKDAYIGAGFTCLTRSMRAGRVSPKYIIDVKGIQELKKIESNGDEIFIGSAVTFNELKTNPLIAEYLPALKDAALGYGDLELRYRATIGGNIGNASPQADSAAPLLVYRARVVLKSLNGERELPLEEFILGVNKTAIKPDEIITGFRIPRPPEGSRSGYLKFKRSAEDRAVVGIAALVANVKDPSQRIVRLAYVSIAKTPVYLREAEEIFKRDEPINKLINEAVKVAQSKYDMPVGKRGIDLRATKEYRLHLIKIGTKALLKKLIEGVEVL